MPAMSNMKKKVAVVGGGPAGLRAAEVAAQAGVDVVLFDHKRSVGRKFLVAGKSGLNLTNAADLDAFLAQYSGTKFPVEQWRTYLQAFDKDGVIDWARGLGVETFVAGGGKVFPVNKKAAPLLRAWALRLRELGVCFQMQHRLVGLESSAAERVQLSFEMAGQRISRAFDAVILALGGGSWPQTGSDGTWVDWLRLHGVKVESLQSANCGWECDWSQDTLAVAEGRPLHHLKIQAGGEAVSGELMVTRYGFEGAPVYRLGRTLRGMDVPSLEIDFKPMFTREHMLRKMESARRNFYKEARLRWKFSEAVCAILRQYYGEPSSAEALVDFAKHCHIPLKRARPVEEVISSAGGVDWCELDANLMLKRLPSVYCAGEMLNWEAPTGGYLLQGCMATGAWVGHAVSSSC